MIRPISMSSTMRANRQNQSSPSFQAVKGTPNTVKQVEKNIFAHFDQNGFLQKMLHLKSDGKTVLEETIYLPEGSHHKVLFSQDGKTKIWDGQYNAQNQLVYPKPKTTALENY